MAVAVVTRDDRYCRRFNTMLLLVFVFFHINFCHIPLVINITLFFLLISGQVASFMLQKGVQNICRKQDINLT